MKQLLSILFLCCISVVASAQIQQGYVKTVGRVDRPGVPLSNVVIKVMGSNALLSDKEGQFTITLPSTKGNSAFFLTNVTREGYELIDADIIGQYYGFTPNVPFVVTMVSQEELRSNIRRIRDNAYAAAQREYNEKLHSLEQQLENHKIDEVSYANQLRNLQNQLSKYNDLVVDLAERYARTDYDVIEGVDREIYAAIELGDLDRADSLIHSKGDIEQRHEKALSWRSDSQKQKKELDQRMAQWEASEVLRKEELLNLAKDYYHAYTIAVSRMQPEVAMQWLDKRVELDPDCFDWLMEAGKYCKIYIGDYSKSMQYFDKAYQLAKSSSNSGHLCWVINEMAGAYIRLNKKEEAEDFYKELLRLTKKQFKGSTELKAVVCNNYGYLLSATKGSEAALEYYQKALEYAGDSLLETIRDVYNNIATAYISLSQYERAIFYIDKAIELASELGRKDAWAISLHNKATILATLGRIQEAISFHEEALLLQKEVLSENHPDIANGYESMAVAYWELSQYKEALSYIDQALDIYTDVFGEEHPQIADGYGKIAGILEEVGHYKSALTYAQEALRQYKLFYTEQSEKCARMSNLLGTIYSDLDQDSLSFEYYQRAMTICEDLSQTKTLLYATICSNVATSLVKNGNASDAISYAQRGLSIVEEVVGKMNTNYIGQLNNLASIYGHAEQLETEITTYLEVERLVKELYGDYHHSLVTAYNNLGNVHMDKKDFDSAREYLFKALAVADSIYPEIHSSRMSILGNIAMTYYRNEQWIETVPWMEKAHVLRVNLLQDATPERRFAYLQYINECYAKHAAGGDEIARQMFKTCQDSIIVAFRILDGGLASEQGLTGEYYLLKYKDWNCNTLISFPDYFGTVAADEPIEIVVWQDGKINSYAFEQKKIGVVFYMLPIDIEEKIRISSSLEISAN